MLKELTNKTLKHWLKLIPGFLIIILQILIKYAENYIKSISIFDATNKTDIMIQTLNNLASTYSVNKSNKETIKTIQKALNLANCYNNLFAEYFWIDSLEKAIVYLDNAVNIYKKVKRF